MLKQIFFLNNSAFFSDRSEFVITDNEQLELELESKHRRAKAYIVGNINDKEFCYYMENGKIALKDLESGILRCSIEFRDCGETIKRFSLEPLKIIKLNEEYKAIPEIEMLKQQIEEIKPILNEIEVLKNSIKTLAKAVLKTVKVGGEDD